MSVAEENTTSNNDFNELLSKDFLNIPKVGDIIKGTVISASKKEVKLDIKGYNSGVVRGKELYNESDEFGNLKPGDEVEATVIEMENENGEMELSFRYAGHIKTWETLNNAMETGEVVKARVLDANKGGLLIRVNHVVGFMPVSQLSPEHYPRVPGGDKNKILEKLKQFVGTDIPSKIIAAEVDTEKLIVSEKLAWEESQKDIISKYKEGDKIKGTITAVTDFGAFVEFDEKLEGLVHISELAWQRIDDPHKIVKVGQEIEAEIIKIDGSKIFLSMKKLQKDPWKDVTEKYKIDDSVTGKVLKIEPYGLFVELDKDIHGLAHISELGDVKLDAIRQAIKIGEELEFKIVSIEPENHRLGLSLADKSILKNVKLEVEKQDEKEKTEKTENDK